MINLNRAIQHPRDLLKAKVGHICATERSGLLLYYHAYVAWSYLLQLYSVTEFEFITAF